MKVTIVAEIASNWEGNVAKAKKLIKECKKAGANAVKFQGNFSFSSGFILTILFFLSKKDYSKSYNYKNLFFTPISK